MKTKEYYEKYYKRLIDIILCLFTIIFFWWIYVVIAILVYIKHGSPIIFKQPRPGIIDPKTGQEKIFFMYKFRSMRDAVDENGELLPDEKRLTGFGRILRASSLDELPEIFNVLKGDMSIVGPRPQLVRDLVFMNDRIRKRHNVKPGITGLAQIKGRNAITWHDKFKWDLFYVDNLNFTMDVKIVLITAFKILCHQESSDELDVTYDYGDWLLNEGKITKKQYNEKMKKAGDIVQNI